METFKIDMDKIKDLAFRRNMSMSKLCTSAGMSRSRSCEWQNRNVTLRTVYRIAQVLEADPMDLIVKEDDGNAEN